MTTAAQSVADIAAVAAKFTEAFGTVPAVHCSPATAHHLLAVKGVNAEILAGIEVRSRESLTPEWIALVADGLPTHLYHRTTGTILAVLEGGGQRDAASNDPTEDSTPASV